jgi:hypothetical protein
VEKKINMLYRSCLFLLSFSLILLTACTGPIPSIPTIIGPTVTPNPNATASLTPFGPLADIPTTTPTIPTSTPGTTVSPTATFTLTPAPAPVFVPSTYTLDVMMDISAHTLGVNETISYQNTTGVTLTGLVLAVESNLWKDCFVPGSLMVNSQAATGLNLSGDRLEVPLAAPLAPGGTLILSLHFDLHLPAADVYHVFGYNDRQTNLVDWYPFIVPYANGWLLNPPANVGEHLVYDESVFEVTIRLTDPGAPVTIAASAPGGTVTGGWHYHLQNARSFVFSASTGYHTASTTVNGVPVTSYHFDGEKAQGRAVLDEVARTLTTFSSLFGPYPYPSLSIVESPFYDGMEYDGLFFLSRDFYTANDGTVLNNLVDIAVHETAHQWWFGSVGSDQAMEPWLDEALATYSERLFYEKNYPEVSAWQAFRIDAYAPTGWVDTDIYHGVDFRTYANAVYLRGAQFLQVLRGRVGDEAFFSFLKDYAAQMAGKRATSADFFRILRQHSSADISDILSAYFQNPK